ncbi:MAG: hypothetical protein QM820_47005 [Minicystis sp.]
MSYATRVLHKLGPFSVSQSFPQLLREWYATGIMEDVEEPVEECDVCGHEHIRYLFQIKNLKNGNVRDKSGSKCILKFDEIGVRFEGRIVYDPTEKQKALDEFLKEYRARLRKEFARQVWVGLQGKDAAPAPIAIMRDICVRIYNTPEENGLLTPKQFAMFVWAAKIVEITIRLTPFQGVMNLRKGKSKDQLAGLHPRQIEDIKGALTPPQLAILERERGGP